MRRPALGFCRLSAGEFDRMTPREVQWRLEAETERENREFERLAQLACWVINPWMEKQSQLRASKLLKRRGTPRRTDWEEWAKD